MQEFDHISIDLLNLSKRTYHALARYGIRTIRDLRQFYLNKDKIQIRNIGEKSLNEISTALEGLHKNLSSLSQNEMAKLQIPEDNKTRTQSVDVLNLSPSIRGGLKKHGIKTIDDLKKTPDAILLRINLIGIKKLAEIKNLLAEFIDNSDIPIINESTTIKENRIVTWSQVIEEYYRHEKDAYSYILISRFGFSPKTLEEIATELGVTRERVRQIQEAVSIRYLKHIRYLGVAELLEKIEKIFSSHGEYLSLTSFETILKAEGILGEFSDTITTDHIKKLDVLETLICWLRLLSDKRYTSQPIKFSVDISSLMRSGKISIRDHTTLMGVSAKERKEIKRKVLFTGGITIKEASKILSQDERVTVLVLKSMNLQNIDAEWFSFHDLDEDKNNSKISLRIAGLKMLALNSELDFDSFHDGLRRHASRFYAGIAPQRVVAHILPLLGFEVRNAKVSTQLSTKGILSQSEKSLISAIEKNGGVASFLEIAEEFFLRNLSLPAVSVTLKRSPIVDKVNEGLYKLRGIEISWQDIEAAQKRQKRFSQNDEITHGLDGIIRMKFTVSNYAFLTGVIGAWSVKELSGSWTIFFDESSFGDARIEETYLWGLAKIFKKMEVKIGERMEIAFNTWNRTISIRKVNNETS